MAAEVVEFADNETLLGELVSRETFSGVVVLVDGYRNNQSQGVATKPTIRVEVSAAATNQEVAEMLAEVRRVLDQFIISR